MSEALAHIRVRERHGIRRFLYPLKAAVIVLPETWKPGEMKTVGEQYGEFALQGAHGENLARQILGLKKISEAELHFALSLAPYEVKDLVIVNGTGLVTLPDPLRITTTLDGGMKNTQERFTVTINPEGSVGEVVYNGVRHLRGPSQIQRNDKIAWHSSTTAHNYGVDGFLQALLLAKSRYDGGSFAQTRVELTACKSWVTLTHTVEQPKPHDEIVFTLPLAITSPTFTCDFGVGGYVFGKLDSKAAEVVWHMEFGDLPFAKWTIATAGRVDYVGEVESAEAFLPQRWFHVIDSDKALAVAITKLPDACQSLTVRLTIEGEVSIAFKLGDAVTGHADFGVCYHFLNDVPAIAAATNPQSILLPPIVEVLPVQELRTRG